MKLKDLVPSLDMVFKKNLALPDDPAGLQAGKADREIKSALVTLDITRDVVQEAVDLKTGLIISHHPLIFNPVFKITDDSAKTSALLELIENKIAIYCAHTNLDAMTGGLNDLVAVNLGLSDIKIIDDLKRQWFKFTVFVPVEAEAVTREVICANGGGSYANYSCCTFNTPGTGTFLPQNGAKPYIGQKGKLEFVKEVRIECVVESDNLSSLVSAVIAAHPYEEPAYDVIRLENSPEGAGIGRIGNIYPPVTPAELMERIKKVFGIKNLRWLSENSPGTPDRKIGKIAVINGSANSLTGRLSVADMDLDAVIAGELKYSNAREIAESGKVYIEIGHGESEKIAIDLLYKLAGRAVKMEKDFKLYRTKTGFLPWRYYIE
jgi:dinuclear metal center YbgI/SA1388 family protein